MSRKVEKVVHMALEKDGDGWIVVVQRYDVIHKEELISEKKATRAEAVAHAEYIRNLYGYDCKLEGE